MPELWTLVFCDPEPLPPGAARRDRVLYWGLSFLRPGFRHVFAIRRLAAGAGAGWLIANWHSGRLDLIEAAGPIDVGPRRFADYGAFVAAMAAAGLATTVTLAASEPRTWRVRGLATCVTAAKHLIGIAAPTAQTPWGLYRHLTKGDAP
jgi:hypothetical protein